MRVAQWTLVAAGVLILAIALFLVGAQWAWHYR